MPALLLTAVNFGSYISPVCFVIFLVMFFLWLWLVTWVHEDASAVNTKSEFWTSIVFAAGAAGLIVWLLIPMFIIGLLFYIILAVASSLSYVMHRNTLVMDYDRILTSDHIKGLFVKDETKQEALKSFVFITSNRNEIPMPEGKTPEFFGFKSSYDLITDAIWRRAEVINISPTHEDYNVVYHVDGASLQQPSILRQQMDYCVTFLKQVSNLEVEEKRKPQKGKFSTRRENDITDWEILTSGSTAGEQIQIKLKTKKEISKIEDIGLSDKQLEEIKQVQQSKQGFFIISGPGMSGVSTTFYAMIRHHDPFIYSINTVEKQPTMDIINVTQNVYGLSDTGTSSYAKKVESVIRMGLDILGVADCDDSDTAKIICKGSRDGKIIYLTLKTENVVQSLTRWIKLVGDRNMALDTLLGASNQRLMRKLCDECKQAYEPNKEILRKFNISAEKKPVFYRAGKVQYDKHGKASTCDHCQGTGFYGRMCVFEIIIMNDILKESLKKAKSVGEIDNYVRSAKMLYLQEQALQRVMDGTTSINEIIRVLSGSQRQQTDQ